MKISSCILVLIGLGMVIYCLFQPMIEMNFGWKSIPTNSYSTRFSGIENQAFSTEIEFAKNRIDSIQRASHAPSISVAAMINGKMIWTYAVGFKDYENKISADTNTQYRIGSTSKALTSLGLGKMIQDGIIHPDSSVQFYANSFDDIPAITIRQLASHQSGIRNYGFCFCFPIWEYYRSKEFNSIEESTEDFNNNKLLFTPGDSFAYSSYNFTALSLAMENASPSGFLSYMENDVFNFLEMFSTVPDKENEILPNRATTYEINGNLFRETFEVNLSNKWAGGGYLSTPSDLVRAGNALLNTGLLNAETIDLITTPQRLNNDSINEQSYALGWRHSSSSRYFDGTKPVKVTHHGGMAMGGLALLVVYPEYGLVFAITLNKGDTPGNFKLFDYVTPIANTLLKKIDENDT